MKWLVLACLLVVFVGATVNAQGVSSNPNLNGKWFLESQSDAGIGAISLPASTSVQLEINDSNSVKGRFRQRLTAGRYQEVEQVEEWELAADGKTLTQFTTRRFEDRAFVI